MAKIETTKDALIIFMTMFKSKLEVDNKEINEIISQIKINNETAAAKIKEIEDKKQELLDLLTTWTASSSNTAITPPKLSMAQIVSANCPTPAEPPPDGVRIVRSTTNLTRQIITFNSLGQATVNILITDPNIKRKIKLCPHGAKCIGNDKCGYAHDFTNYSDLKITKTCTFDDQCVRNYCYNAHASDYELANRIYSNDIDPDVIDILIKNKYRSPIITKALTDMGFTY
jgi:hypothetical protein